MIIKKARAINSIKSIVSALNYIQNKKKCIQSSKDNRDLKNTNLNTLLKYVTNESKTDNLYVSSYLCNYDTAIEDFILNAVKDCEIKGTRLEEDNGNLAYHFVQSFVEGLEISDDDVHQCGRDLLQKIHDYPAIIASHIHPVQDKEGIIRGKCKHNHFVISAYKYNEYIDPNNKKRIKFNDCKETLRQLKRWNDEIMKLRHYPIIISTSKDPELSWVKYNNGKNYNSFKNLIRKDIDECIENSKSWKDFEKKMKMKKYKIKKKNDNSVTYITPNNVEYPDYYLGGYYKVNSIQKKFNTEKNFFHLKKEQEQSKSIEEIIQLTKKHENLFVHISHKKKRKNDNGIYVVSYPFGYLNHFKIFQNCIIPDKKYELVDDNNNCISKLYGKDILKFYEYKYQKQNEIGIENLEMELKEINPEFKLNKNSKTMYNKYLNENYKNFETYIPIYVYNYRKSCLELIFELASLILQNHFGIGKNDEVVLKNIDVKRNERIQNLVDAQAIAYKYDIRNMTEANDIQSLLQDNLSDLSNKLNDLKTSYFEKKLEKESLIAYQLEIKAKRLSVTESKKELRKLDRELDEIQKLKIEYSNQILNYIDEIKKIDTLKKDIIKYSEIDYLLGNITLNESIRESYDRSYDDSNSNKLAKRVKTRYDDLDIK